MIADNSERHRFEQEEDGKLVFASYRMQGATYALVHVEADPQLRGTGAAGRFMTALMDYARGRGLKLQPFCSYARAWFQRHPDDADLLP